MTPAIWTNGLICTAAMGVLVALVGIMLRQGDQPLSRVRTLVVSLLGSLLGFFVGVVVQDTWHSWYACVLCAITAALVLRIAFGRGDAKADAADAARRREESEQGAGSAVSRRG